MSNEAAFLQAIRARPDDDGLRLVYADWLEECGDARAEFLRIECLLRTVAEADPCHRTFRRRLGELGSQVDVRWLAIVCRAHIEVGPAYEHPSRCPLTVPGPFYTCGNCLACDAPEAEAPDLLAPLGSGNSTTYFLRQPETAAEIERACRAAEVCCVMDLRYGGTDPKIIARLKNDPSFCDNLLAEDSATFVAAPPEWRVQTPSTRHAQDR
jgi:uncharacterized protein (TIGR02996 family)